MTLYVIDNIYKNIYLVYEDFLLKRPKTTLQLVTWLDD